MTALMISLAKLIIGFIFSSGTINLSDPTLACSGSPEVTYGGNSW